MTDEHVRDAVLGSLAEMAGTVAGLRVQWSPYTRCWYATIDGGWISDGSFRTGMAEHVPDVNKAVERLWQRLTNLGADEHIVLDVVGGGERRVRWNGYAWLDVPAAVLVGRVTEEPTKEGG